MMRHFDAGIAKRRDLIIRQSFRLTWLTIPTTCHQT